MHDVNSYYVVNLGRFYFCRSARVIRHVFVDLSFRAAAPLPVALGLRLEVEPVVAHAL